MDENINITPRFMNTQPPPASKVSALDHLYEAKWIVLTIILATIFIMILIFIIYIKTYETNQPPPNVTPPNKPVQAPPNKADLEKLYELSKTPPKNDHEITELAEKNSE